MALHPNFPASPHAILDPAVRWFPADEALRESSADKLMPPLVPQLRKKVKEWRDGGYLGATNTSKSLLNYWFNAPHLLSQTDGAMAEFQYYFAQCEALETIIYLYDVVGECGHDYVFTGIEGEESPDGADFDADIHERIA